MPGSLDKKMGKSMANQWHLNTLVMSNELSPSLIIQLYIS
jgi:hypothetical protein